MSDIFLSYASQDIERVRCIVDELEAQGWSVWWDRALKPGETWPSVIERQLKRARCVVVAWSTASVASPWVRMEANKARERKILVPILLEDVQIPPEFGSIQAVALHADPDTGKSALVDGVRTQLRRRAAKGIATSIGIFSFAAVISLMGTCLTTDMCDGFGVTTLSERSIAVLAFENQIGNKHLADIADVFVDELRESLAAIKGQPVAARAATRAIPSNLTPIEIGERLRVRWLVAGTISETSDQLELAVEAIDANSGYLASSERYMADIAELDGTRSEIIGDLLTTMGVSRSPDIATTDSAIAETGEAYVLYLRGKALLRQRKFDEAEAFFNQAQSLNPDYPEAEAGLCRVALNRFKERRDSGDYEMAREHCQQALTAERRSADAGLALGELYLLEGYTDKAQDSFAQALALNESSAEALIGLARVAEQAGRVTDAVSLLRKATLAQRGYWRPYNELGIVLLGMGQIEEARVSFDNALALASADSAVLNNLAVTYVMMAEFDRAVDAWSRVLELEQDALAYGNLGSAYYWSGSMLKAIAMYQEAVRLHPKDFRWWSSLADAQLQIESEDPKPALEQALAQTAEELKINPDNIDAKVGRAPILAALGRREEAQTVLEEVASSISTNPELTYIAAVAAMRLGDVTTARRYLDTSRELGYPEVLIHADPTFKEILEASSQIEEQNLKR